MKEIKLTQGKVTQVDDQDYEKIKKYKWHAIFQDKWYAGAWDYSSKPRKYLRLHAFLMGTIGTNWLVDHKDGNSLNNTRTNLRVCTPLQNAINRKPVGASKYSGVTKRKETNGKCVWLVRITIDGKRIIIGRFPFTSEGEVEAAKAWDEVAKKGYGEFARLNFPKNV